MLKWTVSFIWCRSPSPKTSVIFPRNPPYQYFNFKDVSESWQPTKCRAAKSDCQQFSVFEDIPVCGSSMKQMQFVLRAVCNLPEVSHMLSHFKQFKTCFQLQLWSILQVQKAHTWLCSQLRGSSLARKFLRLRRAGEGLEKGTPSESSRLWLPSLLLELLLEVELEQERVVCVLRWDRGDRDICGGFRTDEGGVWQGHWKVPP